MKLTFSESGYHDITKWRVAAMATWLMKAWLSFMFFFFLGYVYIFLSQTFSVSSSLRPTQKKHFLPLFLSDAETSAPGWPNLSRECVSGRKWSMEPPQQTASHEVKHSPGTAMGYNTDQQPHTHNQKFPLVYLPFCLWLIISKLAVKR